MARGLILPENTFSELFDQLCGALSTGGFPVILANIPRVKSIPFFTTIAPSVGLFIQDAKIQNPEIKGLVFQTTETPFFDIASTNDLLNNSILLTLQASTAAAFIGDTTGAYYNSSSAAIPEGVNVNMPFGLSSENPFPNKFVLDENEQFTVDLITTSYNNAIELATLKYNFELIDIHDFFQKIAGDGYTTDGVTFNSEYIFGGIFSLDGVHPTSQGYAIIANQFIEKINSAFNAEIPLINVANIPGSIELAKKVNFNKFGMPIFEADTFKSIFY